MLFACSARLLFACSALIPFHAQRSLSHCARMASTTKHVSRSVSFTCTVPDSHPVTTAAPLPRGRRPRSLSRTVVLQRWNNSAPPLRRRPSSSGWGSLPRWVLGRRFSRWDGGPPSAHGTKEFTEFHLQFGRAGWGKNQARAHLHFFFSCCLVSSSLFK